MEVEDDQMQKTTYLVAEPPGIVNEVEHISAVAL